MKTNFKNVHTTKDIAISGAITLAGAGLFFLNAGIGTLFVACGLLSLIFYKTGYRIENGDGTMFEKKAFDVDRSCRQSIKDFLDGKDTNPEITAPGYGGVSRMEVYFNKKAGVAYAQLFDFSNYVYEEATDIVELHSPRADKLITKLL